MSRRRETDRGGNAASPDPRARSLPRGLSHLRRRAVSPSFRKHDLVVLHDHPGAGRDLSQHRHRPEPVPGPANGRTRGPVWTLEKMTPVDGVEGRARSTAKSAFGSELHATLALAAPLAAANLAQIAMAVTDSAMVGRLGTLPLAAAGLGAM